MKAKFEHLYVSWKGWDFGYGKCKVKKLSMHLNLPKNATRVWALAFFNA